MQPGIGGRCCAAGKASADDDTDCSGEDYSRKALRNVTQQRLDHSQSQCPASPTHATFGTNLLFDCHGILHYHVRSWIAVHGKIVASDRFCMVSPP